MVRWVELGKAIGILLIGMAVVISITAMLRSVRDRTQMSTDYFTGSLPTSVTYFFMETCPHCVRMKPEWEKFKEMAKAEGIVTKEASPNTNPALVKEKKVSGFPAILITVGDKDVMYPSDSEHPRTAAGVLAFVKELQK